MEGQIEENLKDELEGEKEVIKVRKREIKKKDRATYWKARDGVKWSMLERKEEEITREGKEGRRKGGKEERKVE